MCKGNTRDWSNSQYRCKKTQNRTSEHNKMIKFDWLIVIYFTYNIHILIVNMYGHITLYLEKRVIITKAWAHILVIYKTERKKIPVGMKGNGRGKSCTQIVSSLWVPNTFITFLATDFCLLFITKTSGCWIKGLFNINSKLL